MEVGWNLFTAWSWLSAINRPLLGCPVEIWDAYYTRDYKFLHWRKIENWGIVPGATGVLYQVLIISETLW